MKKFILMTAILFFSAYLGYSADENTNEPQLKTFAGDSGPIKHSGYGGPQVKFTTIDETFGLLVGARGAWTINRTFSLGLAGYGLVTKHEVNYTDMFNEKQYHNINFGYGGIYFEYIHQPLDYVHFSGNVLCGFGGLNVSDRQNWGSSEGNEFDDSPSRGYFVLEPTIAVEFNITRFFRISAEASYRWMTDVWENNQFKKAQGLNNIDLKGLSGGLTFEFGSF